jgi:hypothetical protein
MMIIVTAMHAVRTVENSGSSCVAVRAVPQLRQVLLALKIQNFKF